jgi:hypothetical protein
MRRRQDRLVGDVAKIVHPEIPADANGTKYQDGQGTVVIGVNSGLVRDTVSGLFPAVSIIKSSRWASIG